MSSNSERYKDKPLLLRVKESASIRNKFPDKVPIIVERARVCSSEIPNISRNKYLVTKSFTFGQFIYVIRKQMSLPPEKALFIFINNSLPTASMLMSEIYAAYCSADGFVYMEYTGESTYGMGAARPRWRGDRLPQSWGA